MLWFCELTLWRALAAFGGFLAASTPYKSSFPPARLTLRARGSGLLVVSAGWTRRVWLFLRTLDKAAPGGAERCGAARPRLVRGRVDPTRGRLVGVEAHAPAARRWITELQWGHGWPLSGSIAFHLSLITRVEWTYLLVFYFPLIISSGMGGKWKQLFIREIYVLHLAVWFPQLYQCHLGTGIAFYIFRLQQSSFSICCEASNNAGLSVFL